MAEAGTVSFKLTGDTTKFDEAVEKATSKLKRFGDTSKAVAQKAGVAFAALAYPLAKITSNFAKFDAGLQRAGAIAGASGSEVAQLGQVAMDLAKSTRFAASDVVQAFNVLAQSGQDTGTMLTSISPTLELAAAGLLSIGEAADITTGVMSSFNKKASELGEVNNVIAKLITSTKTDVTGLGQSFEKVGTIASATGIEFEDMAVALGIAAEGNLRGAEAGTSFKTALSRMIHPMGETKKEAERLGMAFRKADGTMRPFPDIIRDIGKSSDVAGSLVKLFGAKGMLGMNILVSKGADAFENLSKKVKDHGGIAQKLATQEMQTLDGRINSMKASLEGAALAIGKSLEPAMRKITDTVGAVADKFASMDPKILAVISGTALLATGLAGLVTVLGLTGVALAAASGGLATMATAAKGAAVSLYTMIPALKTIAAVIWASLAPALIPIAMGLALATVAAGAFILTLGVLSKSSKDTAANIKQGFRDFDLADTMQGAVASLVDLLTGLGLKMFALGKWMGTGFVERLKAALAGKWDKVFAAPGDSLKEAFAEADKQARKIGDNAGESYREATDKLAAGIGKAISGDVRVDAKAEVLGMMRGEQPAEQPDFRMDAPELVAPKFRMPGTEDLPDIAIPESIKLDVPDFRMDGIKTPTIKAPEVEAGFFDPIKNAFASVTSTFSAGLEAMGFSADKAKEQIAALGNESEEQKKEKKIDAPAPDKSGDSPVGLNQAYLKQLDRLRMLARKQAKVYSEIADATEKAAKRAQGLRKSIEGNLTLAFEGIGESLQEAGTEATGMISNALINVGGAISGAASTIAGSLASGAQRFAPVITGAITAFAKAGGGFQGIIAAVVSLLTSSQTFKDVMRMVERSAKGVLSLFDNTLGPALKDLFSSLDVMADISASLLAPAFMLIGTVLGWIAKVIHKVVGAIVKAFNSLIRGIAAVVDKIPGLGKTAKSIRKMQVSFDNFDESIKEATGAVSDINSPRGFKIALERFRAISRDEGESGGSGGREDPDNRVESARPPPPTPEEIAATVVRDSPVFAPVADAMSRQSNNAPVTATINIGDINVGEAAEAAEVIKDASDAFWARTEANRSSMTAPVVEFSPEQASQLGLLNTTFSP